MPAVIPWGSTTSCQYLTTCLVNDRIAIDAGTLGFHGTPEQQAGIDHIFLTHSHLDHLASLPIFLENVYHLRKTPPIVYASRDVLEVLQRDLFNDRLWPDFITLSSRVRPFLRLEPILPGQTLTVEGVTVTAVPVTHVVPTMGFLLRSEAGTVAYVPDTGPTEAIWQAARARSDLRAVLVEATFPNEMAWLAEVSRHLTPLMLRDELSKLGREVPTYVMHLKAHYRREVRDELAMLGLGQLSLLEPGRVYEF
jgi:cAMP phosphodiesterase